jgi:hypothetical protein
MFTPSAASSRVYNRQPCPTLRNAIFYRKLFEGISMSTISDHENTSKLPWVEPEITDLDLNEAQNVSTTGGDGDVHADCTRS